MCMWLDLIAHNDRDEVTKWILKFINPKTAYENIV